MNVYIYIYIFGTWPPASSQERTTLHRFAVITLHHEHSKSSIKDGMENSAKWSDCFKELIVAWLHASSVQLWPVCGVVASLRRTKITRTRSNCCRRRSAVEPTYEFSPFQAGNVEQSMKPKMEVSSVAGPESMR